MKEVNDCPPDTREWEKFGYQVSERETGTPVFKITLTKKRFSEYIVRTGLETKYPKEQFIISTLLFASAEAYLNGISGEKTK